MSDSGCHLVLSTCPDLETAEDIAHVLVEEGLAACVNIAPGLRSIYRWAGEIHIDSECLLIIKSRSAHYARLEARLVALHPYELPEVIAVPITTGFGKYLAWVKAPETRPDEMAE